MDDQAKLEKLEAFIDEYTKEMELEKRVYLDKLLAQIEKLIRA